MATCLPTSAAVANFPVSRTRILEDDNLLGGLKTLCQEGLLQEAVRRIDFMHQERLHVSSDVFSCLLQTCIDKKDLTSGREVYSRIVRNGSHTILLGNRLIHMFASCGSLLEATQVFSKLSKPNVYTWTAIISAHAKLGQDARAIELYYQMQRGNVKPDAHVFVAVLTACSNSAALTQGRLVHGHIRRNGLETNLFVANTLINMYAKCHSLKDALGVFNKLPKRDAVTWGAMITAYTEHRYGQKALQLFQQMQDEAIEPTRVTFICILKSCSSIVALDQGKRIHKHIIESGLDSNVCIGNILIDMYAKCGSLDDASAVFERMSKRDIVTWSVMIEGCNQHGYGEKAVCIFQQMQEHGVGSDRINFVSILKACSNAAALVQGKQIHAYIIENDLELHLFIGNTLIDMYAKCGSLQDARTLFIRLPKQDIASWNAMIGGCAQHNDFNFALQCFEEMQVEGLKPNEITFVCLLSASSHAGLVHEGFGHFKLLKEDLGLAPSLDHHNCMVSLLSHAGHINDAEDLLQTMPFGTNVVGWMSLLSHCKSHGNVEQGWRCFDQVVTMEPRKSAGYVLMSQLYAHAGLNKNAESLEDLRISANAWKKPANALIEIDSKVHHFDLGGQSHPDNHDIHAKLKRISVHMKEGGYMPQLDLVQQLVQMGTKTSHPDAAIGWNELYPLA